MTDELQIKAFQQKISENILKEMQDIKLFLERQIPKKPIKEDPGDFDFVVCPNCGGSISTDNILEHIMNREKTYCEHCGQAIDWSDDDDG